MIQRIQTLYLLLSVLFCISFHYLPMGHISAGQGLDYFTYGFVSVETGEVISNATVSVLVLLLVMLLQLFAIVSFKNRPRQAMLAQVSLVLLVLFAVSVLMSPDLFDMVPGKAENGRLEFTWNVFLVGIPWVLTYLAIRSIRKDEALVRSADRMR